jgi:hypothetical protein
MAGIKLQIQTIVQKILPTLLNYTKIARGRKFHQVYLAVMVLLVA